MSSKRVGVITSYLDFNKNYGGILQAYALCRQVSLLGYEACVMPYIYEHIPCDPHENQIVWQIYRYLLAHCLPANRRKLKQRGMNKMLLQFVRDSLPLYQEKRITAEELASVQNDFYAFICGSDQVWSTKLQRDRCDPGMFLKFVSKPVKKIAYAPSMGSTIRVSEETAEDIASALKDFDAISVREKRGRDLLQAITGKEYRVVLDPTLLLPFEEWDGFCEPPRNLPEKYILLYRFGNIKANMEHIRRIQEATGLPVVEIPSSQISLGDPYEKRYDINPMQFVGIIDRAALVCTDSFHATVFSIIRKTPFVCFYRQEPSDEYNMNARVEELLSMTGLSGRLFRPDQEVDLQALFDIEFDTAHRNIEALRGDSLAYLCEALSGG